MQNIVVTGGNRGLGYEIAQALSDQQNHIIIACRDVAHGNAVAKNFAGSSEVLELNLCSEQSITSFSEYLAHHYSQIDVLMNNAGIFDNSGQQLPFMGQHFSNVWITNTLGPYLLTKQLTPLLERAQQPKCVFMSSVVGHHKRLNLQAVTEQGHSEMYGQSKYADLLLTELFSKKQPNWQVLAAHPGYSNTAIFDGRISGWKKQIIRHLTNRLGQSPKKGAQSAILAIKQDLPSGSYIGPKYLNELYGPPRVQHIQNYIHQEDLPLLNQFLNELSK